MNTHPHRCFHKTLSMLPQDTLDLIAMFSGSYMVIRTLKTTPSITFHQKNVSLVYGQVQSGKTSMIFNLIQQSTLHCVLIIQNSLIVLQQYKQRLATQHISYSTVYQYNPSAKVTILMNNSHQYRKYIPPLHFSLIMDESDLTRHNPLIPLSTNQFHVTATPFRYKPIFDRIICITPPEDYYGIEKVNYLNKPYDEQGMTDYVHIVEDFTANDGGILLISEFNYVSEMHSQARVLSLKFDLPILVLSTQKKIYRRGKSNIVSENNISKIIDSIPNKHIIVIANRMANRGLSFTSSDFKIHITHQVFGKLLSITSFLQKSRIFGVYKDQPNLKAYVPPDYMKKITSYKSKVSLNIPLYKPNKDNLYYIDKPI